MEEYLDLIKYRDAGMNSYTYFWKNYEGKVVSPYFDTDADAIKWAKDKNVPILTMNNDG